MKLVLDDGEEIELENAVLEWERDTQELVVGGRRKIITGELTITLSAIPKIDPEKPQEEQRGDIIDLLENEEEINTLGGVK